MKKSKIKIVFALLTLLIFMLNICAFAQSEAVFNTQGYNVIKADKSDEVSLAEVINRSEMAGMIANLFGKGEETMGLRVSFADVMDNDENYDAIAYLQTLGLIVGTDNGTFRPQDNATAMEAVKIVVSCLGYDLAAIRKGGYPEGYKAVAYSLGLLENVNINTSITRLEMLHLINNALKCNILEENLKVNDKNYELTKGDTLESVVKNINGRKIIKSKGFVQATYYDYTDYAIKDIKKNQIDIDGILYYTGDCSAEKYLGMEVEFYALQNDDYTYTLTSIRPTNKNEVTYISAKNLLDPVQGKVVYEKGKKTESIDYKNGARVLYNGRPLTEYKYTDITSENGSVKMIDNNGDKIADVIMITEFYSGVLKFVSNDVIYFEPYEAAGDMMSLAIDTEEENAKYILRDEQGNIIKPDTLEEGCVISVAVDKALNRYEITVSSKTAEGVIASTSEEDGILINDVWYKTEKGKNIDYRLGDSVSVLLNYEGDIVKLKSLETKKRYGYIIALEKIGLSAVKVKMLEAGLLKAEQEIDDTDPDNPIITRILRAGNKDVAIYSLANKVKIEGTLYSSDDAMKYIDTSSPLEYTLNEDGEIKAVEYPEKSGTGEERYYNSYEKTFGKMGGSVFATNEETNIICVPTNGVTNERDLLAKIDMDENDQKYTIAGYDVDEQTGYAELVVLKAALTADAMDNINSGSEVAVAERVLRVNDDGLERVRVDFYSEGKKMSYCMSEQMAQNYSDVIKSGSVFLYALTNSNEIGEIQVLEHLSRNTPWYMSGTEETQMSFFGGVGNIQYDSLSYEKNRFVHKMTVYTSEGTDASATVDINVRNAPYIYLYNAAKRSVSVIEPIQIASGRNYRTVYGYFRNSNAKVFVVVE